MDAQKDSKTLFLRVSVKVFVEQISPWTGGLSEIALTKVDGPHPIS